MFKEKIRTLIIEAFCHFRPPPCAPSLSHDGLSTYEVTTILNFALIVLLLSFLGGSQLLASPRELVKTWIAGPRAQFLI